VDVYRAHRGRTNPDSSEQNNYCTTTTTEHLQNIYSRTTTANNYYNSRSTTTTLKVIEYWTQNIKVKVIQIGKVITRSNRKSTPRLQKQNTEQNRTFVRTFYNQTSSRNRTYKPAMGNGTSTGQGNYTTYGSRDVRREVETEQARPTKIKCLNSTDCKSYSTLDSFYCKFIFLTMSEAAQKTLQGCKPVGLLV